MLVQRAMYNTNITIYTIVMIITTNIQIKLPSLYVDLENELI